MHPFIYIFVLCLLLLHCLFLISNDFSFTLTLLLDPETVDQVHSCFFCVEMFVQLRRWNPSWTFYQCQLMRETSSQFIFCQQ